MTTDAALAEAAERVGEEAAALLVLLQPWERQPAAVRSACAMLTLALAALARALPEEVAP